MFHRNATYQNVQHTQIWYDASGLNIAYCVAKACTSMIALDSR